MTRVYRTTGSRVAIGRSIRIAGDEEVSDVVVVIGGSLRVDGRVRDGVVVAVFHAPNGLSNAKKAAAALNAVEDKVRGDDG